MFRDAMGKFATGITIVSAEYKDQIHGMTVNAFMSVSLDPKLIAVSIDEKASMYRELQEINGFGVSVLSDNQQDVSMVYAKQKEKDREILFERLNGVPVVQGSLVKLACEIHETAKAGDHMIFIAEVKDVQLNDGEPIVYYGGKYRNLEQT